MMKNIIIILAMLAAMGSNAPVCARQHMDAEPATAADSIHKKKENVKKSTASAARKTAGTVEESRRKVAAAHDAAAQRRLADAQRRLNEAQKRLQQAQERLEKESARLSADGESQEAYSDTTSGYADDGDAADTSVYMNGQVVDDNNRYNPSRFDDPFSWFAYMCGSSFWGVLITVIILLLTLLFFAMPLIVVIMIVRYMVRRHNDRVRLAEMAMKEGRPITDEQMNIGSKPCQYLWRRGVRNLSLGLGLALFFYVLGASPLSGIGLLVACMGGGQMFMARYNYDTKFRRRTEPGDDIFGGDGVKDGSDDIFGTGSTGMTAHDGEEVKRD